MIKIMKSLFAKIPHHKNPYEIFIEMNIILKHIFRPSVHIAEYDNLILYIN